MPEYWTNEEIGSLVQNVSDGKHYYEISLLLDRSPEACRKKVSSLGLRHPKANVPWSGDRARTAATLDWVGFSRLYPSSTPADYQADREAFRTRLSVPDLETTDYSKLVYQVEEDVVIAACVHVPNTDSVMWGKLLAIGERDKIPGLILAGDAVTADMYSKWPSDGVSQTWGWDKELESLKRHLSAALSIFETVYILPGNHMGNRIIRVTNGHIKLAQVLNMAGLSDAERDRIVTTDLDYITLYSGNQEFLVAHSTNYSVRGGQVPVDYAEKYQTHVIAGNGHIFGHQVTKSGKFHGWDLGTLGNINGFGYAMRGLTKYPKMQQSFVTVRNGTVKVYGAGKPTTDWEAELSIDA